MRSLVILFMMLIPVMVYTQWDGNCGAVGDPCDFFMPCCVPHICLKMEHGEQHVCYSNLI